MNVQTIGRSASVQLGKYRCTGDRTDSPRARHAHIICLVARAHKPFSLLARPLAIAACKTQATPDAVPLGGTRNCHMGRATMVPPWLRSLADADGQAIGCVEVVGQGLTLRPSHEDVTFGTVIRREKARRGSTLERARRRLPRAP